MKKWRKRLVDPFYGPRRIERELTAEVTEQFIVPDLRITYTVRGLHDPWERRFERKGKDADWEWHQELENWGKKDELTTLPIRVPPSKTERLAEERVRIACGSMKGPVSRGYNLYTRYQNNAQYVGWLNDYSEGEIYGVKPEVLKMLAEEKSSPRDKR